MLNFTRKNKYAFEDDVEMDDFGGYNDNEQMEEVNEQPMQPAVPVAAPAPVAPTFSAAPVSLKIITPKKYEDAKEITDLLMNGNTILLNMDGIGKEIAMRVIDYLKGAIQVVGGLMTKVGKTTLVVAPKNVDVSSIEAMVESAE